MSNVNMDKCDLVLLGDLNKNMLPNSKGSKGEKQELIHFSRILDLSQLIKEPTRVSDKSQTLIDIILVNNEHRVVDSGVVPFPLIDHHLICCVLKASVTTKAPPRTIEHRSYKILTSTPLKKI